jgi:hypothetical protein
MSTVLPRFLSVLILALGLLGAAAADPDPPARVGRASLVDGDVAYLREGEWVPLPVNWPITTGTRLSAAPGARAEVRVGSTAIRLAAATELEISRLDDDAIALRLLYGTIDARVRSAEVASELSVDTPEAQATLLEPGRYRFESGVAPDMTTVSADIGAVRVAAGGNSFVVRPGQRAEVQRGGEVRLAEVRPDAFDEWTLARDRGYDASRSARYVSPEMTGHESLDEHGDWREIPEYGQVWVPRAVPAGWAPYRAGRWAWIAPWGWTWIDEAPWGFAPFHYGRWAFVGGTWMWAPGRIVARPVYAPALVGWVGRPGWSVSVSIGTAPAVGWFPLAPREVFVPAYRHSPAYVRNVNVAHVTNVTQTSHVDYVNRRIDHAVTVVPAAAVTHGQPVARSHVHVRRAELDRHASTSPTPPVTAVAPPRPAIPQARRDDDRRVQRRFESGPRSPEGARAERREERRPESQAQPTPTSPRAVEARRDEAPRASAPPAPPNVPRTIEVRPEPRREPRQQAQRIETPRAVAPTTSAQPPQQMPPRFEPRREAQRVQPPRFEPRREAQRVQPPRVAAPAAPIPTPPQPRVETRPSPPMPVVRAPPPAAIPAPQPQQSAPRGDGNRWQGREERRSEGRGAG